MMKYLCNTLFSCLKQCKIYSRISFLLRTLCPILFLLLVFDSQRFQAKKSMWEDSALIFLFHLHPSLGYHCTTRIQQTSTAGVTSLFSVHKRYKLGPIFLRTVSMSTLYLYTALRGQHRSSLFALRVEANFLFQFDGPGFRTEL